MKLPPSPKFKVKISKKAVSVQRSGITVVVAYEKEPTVGDHFAVCVKNSLLEVNS